MLPKRLRLGVALSLASVCGLLGCGGGDAPLLSKSQSDLTRSQAQWKSANIRSYRYTLRRSCFCSPDTLAAVVIEVRNGAAFSVKTSSGASADAASVADMDTIDEIFAKLQSVLNTPKGAVNASYNALYGYPATANIDPIPDAADDELGLEISDFQRLD